MDVQVVLTGPLFDGRAAGILQNAAEELVRTLTDLGQQRLVSPFPEGVPVKTGYYQSHIQQRVDSLHGEVSDSGVIYGPWLETGQSSRPTRFRGYQTFERAEAYLEGQVPTVTQNVMDRALKELGG